MFEVRRASIYSDRFQSSAGNSDVDEEQGYKQEYIRRRKEIEALLSALTFLTPYSLPLCILKQVLAPTQYTNIMDKLKRVVLIGVRIPHL